MLLVSGSKAAGQENDETDQEDEAKAAAPVNGTAEIKSPATKEQKKYDEKQ
jgi:hypothetical protein